MSKYCFGVDLGGTTVKMGVFSENGEIIDKWEIKTRTENAGEAILPDISTSVLKKIDELKRALKEAIEKEEFELAATLRDEINALSGGA